MQRWLLCLGLCCAVAACEGGDETTREETAPIGSPDASLRPSEASSAPVSDGGPPQAPDARAPDGAAGDPTHAGVGDGETGSNPRGAGRFGGAADAVGAAPVGAGPVGASTPSAAGASERTSASGASSTSSGVSVGPPPITWDAGLQKPVQPGTLTAGTWDDNRNFERFQAYRADPVRAAKAGVLPIGADDFVQAHAAVSQVPALRTRLDVALVIDTTGSMGDEIRYLQTEFVAISRAIETKYPNAEQRWALVLYKDVGDEYLTRFFDFRSQSSEFRDKLAAQSAGGGGDFPEAPEAAFEVLNQFAWRSDGDVAKLAFWVADAPHHTENATKFAAALKTARSQNIHVYPVASSGVDDLTELTMRSAAQLTGGRYLFLTDDSGVGGVHKEPTIPCYFVTKLDDALLRMVDIELSGLYREPEASAVLRTGGDPKAGICTLSSGQTVQVY